MKKNLNCDWAKYGENFPRRNKYFKKMLIINKKIQIQKIFNQKHPIQIMSAVQGKGKAKGKTASQKQTSRSHKAGL